MLDRSSKVWECPKEWIDMNGCFVELSISIIGGKWKGIILYHLLDGPKRFNELRRLIPKITQRMLTLQLKELEKDKIINRIVFPEIPPHVEYEYTEFGETLQPIIYQMQKWGETYTKEYFS
ncbi:winged helix-turn-helix transcriptional regulator (plasmid) [Vagococcus lutrae]|uniref:winged helix-turn-helix transcriptional regulator n=1 Tax=Vagococcus lutrae TaxID=81947 RepID=UPI00232BA869|nr:winged helix-turn-helix transcriptional regulator [Vagococcus lutrae]WCG06124.1 winged helix-turn-helix transcriptional regulator [Vagococcus lutrae]